MSRPGGRASRILRNTLSNSVGKFVVLATSFAMTPFILRSLGEADFGVWVLATVVISYGALLDLGMGSAIVKHVADASARGDESAARTLLATATRIYLALSIVVLALGLVVARQIQHFVDLGPTTASTAAAVLALTTVIFALNLAGTPAGGALRGLQRYDLTTAITVVNTLATAALTVLVLSRGMGVVAMVAVIVPVTLLSQVVTVVLLRRLDPTFAPRWSPVSRTAARSLTRFGLTLSVSQLAVLLQKRTSEIIIASILSVSAVAPFSLARRLSELPHMISDQFIKVLLPVASETNATGEPGGLRRLYLVSTRITLVLVLPLALCVGFLAGDLLELWVGEQYRVNAVLVVVLVIASVAFTSQWPARSVFQGIGRFGWFAVASLVSGALNVLLTIVLVQRYGLIGVVFGTLVPTALEALCFVLPYAARKLDVSARALTREVLVPAVLPAVPCAGVLLLAGWLTDRASWLALIVAAAAAAGAYLGTYLLLPAASAERALARRVLAPARRR